MLEAGSSSPSFCELKPTVRVERGGRTEPVIAGRWRAADGRGASLETPHISHLPPPDPALELNLRHTVDINHLSARTDEYEKCFIFKENKVA